MTIILEFKRKTTGKQGVKILVSAHVKNKFRVAKKEANPPGDALSVTR